MFTHQGKTVFVDPLRNADGYAVYYQQDAYSRLEEEADKVIGSEASRALAHKVQVDGNVRKRYVIAISAAGNTPSSTVAPRCWPPRPSPPCSTGSTRCTSAMWGRVSAGQRQRQHHLYRSGQRSFTNGDADVDINSAVQANAQTLPSAPLGQFDIGHVVNTGAVGWPISVRSVPPPVRRA